MKQPPLFPTSPQKEDTTQTSCVSHEDTVNNICISLAQMVASGFLLLDFDGFQYFFSPSTLRPTTPEEKCYSAIFGSNTLVLNGSYNPLLKEFGRQQKNQITNKKPSIIVTSKRNIYVAMISMAIGGLCANIPQSNLKIAKLIEHQVGEPVLISIAIVCGIIIFFALGNHMFNIFNHHKSKNTIFHYKNKMIMFPSNTTQQNNLDSNHILIQTFLYAMASTKDWEELAKTIQNHPVLHPLYHLCSNNFKKTIGQALLK